MDAGFSNFMVKFKQRALKGLRPPFNIPFLGNSPFPRGFRSEFCDNEGSRDDQEPYLGKLNMLSIFYIMLDYYELNIGMMVCKKTSGA